MPAYSLDVASAQSSAASFVSKVSAWDAEYLWMVTVPFSSVTALYWYTRGLSSVRAAATSSASSRLE